MKRPAKPAVLLLALAVLMPNAGMTSEATASPAAKQSADAQIQPKAIWGMLLNLIGNSIFQVLGEWLSQKLAPTYEPGSLKQGFASAGGAALVSLAQYFQSKDIVLVGAAPNATESPPDTPLVVENGRENYQGISVALVSVDDRGNPLGYRSISEGFRTGERFKLRVISTFEALLVLDNITPRGEQRQIYPPSKNDAIKLKAGEIVFVPLAADQFFEFAGTVGKDKLVVTVRDPRSLRQGQASSQPAHRKDDEFGTSFVQEVRPGVYPMISEAIAIEHRAADRGPIKAN